MTSFVQTSILCQKQVKDRVVILVRWVGLAKTLSDLGNYEVASYIIFALNTAVLMRLRTTFEQFKSGHEAYWNLLLTLTESYNICSINSMYEKFVNTSGFCLPVICVLTKKIATIHETFKDDPKKELIDFYSRQPYGGLLQKIGHWKSTDYLGDNREFSLKFIENLFQLKVNSVDENWVLSYQIEPSQKSLPLPLTPVELVKRKSKELKQNILRRVPTLPINETITLVDSPSSPSLFDSDLENQSPERSSHKNALFNIPTVASDEKRSSKLSKRSSSRVSDRRSFGVPRPLLTRNTIENSPRKLNKTAPQASPRASAVTWEVSVGSPGIKERSKKIGATRSVMPAKTILRPTSPRGV
jgi:hypothetical protein